MFNQRKRKRVIKVLAITAACTMFSMFGTSISNIEAVSMRMRQAFMLHLKTVFPQILLV